MDGATDDQPAGGAKRRAPTRKYEAKQAAFVRAAVEELNRKGMRGMTLGDVAARLNLVPTGVIYYFKSKEDLAAAAFTKGIERFEALIAAGEGRKTDAQRIEALVDAYFEDKRGVARDEADQIVVFNDVRALNSPSVNAAYVAMFRNARRLLAGPEVLPRLHRNARAHLLLSEMFWIVAWLDPSEADDYPRAAERMGAILTRGMVADGVAWPQPQPILLAREGDPDSEASSELFLRAATELINEEGYHGASVERIAGRLNFSKGAFYHHNETKDELVVACFERTLDTMWRAIHEAERAGGSGLQVLVTIAAALIERQTRGGAPLLRTSALTSVPEAIHARLLGRFDRLTHRFASILCDGIADGSIRPVDVSTAAQMLTAAINAAAEIHYWAPGLTSQTVVDHYVRPLFEGLCSAARP